MASSPDSSYGGSPSLRVGPGEKALLRFGSVPVPSDRGATCSLELVIDKITGDWTGGEIAIYQVAPGDAGWSAGQANGQPQNGATCWNYLLFADTKDVKTGVPLHTPMGGQKGLSEAGKDYLPQPLAKIKVPADPKDFHLTIPLSSSASFGSGLLLVAEGLAPGAQAHVLFHSSESPKAEARPALVIQKANSLSTGDQVIRYELKTAGFVSLNVYNEQGQIVREILHGAERSAGPQEERWDGLDEARQKLPPGSYSWKLLETQGLQAEYLMTLGLSVDHFDLWPGNHIGVSGVAVDASGVYFGSGCSEAPGFVMKMAPDGKRLWTQKPYWFEAWQGPDSLAVDGKNAFLMQENYHIAKISAEDGSKIAIWDLSYDKAKPTPKDEAAWTEMKFGRAAHTSAVDLAAGSGKLVMSYEKFDCIRWVDQETGRVLQEIKVKAPQGVALDNEGHALVISNGEVVVVDETGSNRTLIPLASLTDPWRISVNRTNGDIWVAEQGAGQQVKRFSSAGKLLQTFGAKGGRPAQGLYDGQAGFRNINAIAAAPDGSFWISEAFAAPRRLAHFDAEGKLLREWYGPQMYANRASADPADPTLIWLDSMWGEVIQAKVDYAAKTWKVLATYNYMTPLQTRYRHENGMWFVGHANGHTYLARESEPDVMMVDEPGRRLVPVYQEGVAFYPGGNPGWRIPPDFRPLEEPWPGQTSPSPKPPAPWHFTWAPPKIGDPITRESITFGRELLTFPHASFVRPDLTYVTSLDVSWKEANNAWQHKGGPSIFQPGDLSSSGIPQYDFTQAGNLPLKMPDYLGAVRCLWEDKDGNIFTAHNVTKSRAGEGPFGVGKTAKGVAANLVAKWSPDGTLRWVAGQHAAGAKANPGEARMFYRMAGTVRGCIAVNDIDYSMVHVWDTDGLWVGRLLDHGLLTSAIPKEAYEICGENFGGYLFENQQDGNIYFLGGAQNASALYRITGWDKFEKQEGKSQLK